MQAQSQTPYVRRPYVPIELPESARPKQYKHLVYTLACLYFTLESCILKICEQYYGKFDCIWHQYLKILKIFLFRAFGQE